VGKIIQNMFEAIGNHWTKIKHKCGVSDIYTVMM